MFPNGPKGILCLEEERILNHPNRLQNSKGNCNSKHPGFLSFLGAIQMFCSSCLLWILRIYCGTITGNCLVYHYFDKEIKLIFSFRLIEPGSSLCKKPLSHISPPAVKFTFPEMPFRKNGIFCSTQISNQRDTFERVMQSGERGRRNVFLRPFANGPFLDKSFSPLFQRGEE